MSEPPDGGGRPTVPQRPVRRPEPPTEPDDASTTQVERPVFAHPTDLDDADVSPTLEGSGALIGTVIDGRYRLTGVVGRGGMGTVYAALQVRLHDRPCAVKVLTHKGGGEQWRRRFQAEVRIISALRDPHIVDILDTGELSDERPYLVMELLDGVGLDRVLREGPLPVARALRVAEGVLAALAEAHRQGIVHRDLKPANIFLTTDAGGNDFVKVLDFGVAKELDQPAEMKLTAHGRAVGTPRYMAPEQFMGQGIDGRADLYAVGILLYYMLSGRPPFMPEDQVPEELAEVSSDSRLGWMHLHRPPPAIPRISPSLWAVVKRLLAKAASARYPDADAARAALRELPDAAGVLRPGAAADKPRVDPALVAELTGPMTPVAPKRRGVAPLLLALAVLGGVVAWLLSARG